MPDDYNPDFPSIDDPEPETPSTKPITKSILLTVKKMLGIAEEYHAFDLDIIVNINAVFLTLNQLGVGPSTPYQIAGVDETWADFLGDQEEFIAGVQTYTYLRVRLMFDPPTNSFLVDSFQKQIQELEWRFTVQPKNQQELDNLEFFKDFDENQNGSDEPPENLKDDENDSLEEIEQEMLANGWSGLKATSLKRVSKVKSKPTLLDIFS